jgi:hypothetical protein
VPIILDDLPFYSTDTTAVVPGGSTVRIKDHQILMSAIGSLARRIVCRSLGLRFIHRPWATTRDFLSWVCAPWSSTACKPPSTANGSAFPSTVHEGSRCPLAMGRRENRLKSTGKLLLESPSREVRFSTF